MSSTKVESVTMPGCRSMTTDGLANRRSADRARRRALSRMLAEFRAEAHELLPPGQRGRWGNNTHWVARLIRDRHPKVWKRVLAEERAKETFIALRRGRPSHVAYRNGAGVDKEGCESDG